MSNRAFIIPVTSYEQSIMVREVQTAVTKGQMVKYHTDFLKVVPTATSGLVDLCCGIATETVAAGGQVEICKSGVVQVLVDGTTSVAVGDRLVASTSNAGVLIKDAAIAVADVQMAIVALEAQATAQVAGTLTYCKVTLS